MGNSLSTNLFNYWTKKQLIESRNHKVKPSETIVREVFKVFGPLRAVDIPMLDPYRSSMISSASKTFAFEQDGLFDAYIQYQEYMGFVKCMTAFKGMKLLLKKSDHWQAALIQVHNCLSSCEPICFM